MCLLSIFRSHAAIICAIETQYPNEGEKLQEEYTRERRWLQGRGVDEISKNCRMRVTQSIVK